MINAEEQFKDLCYNIIGAAYEVRSVLGRHLYEGVYLEALQIELGLKGIESTLEYPLDMTYKGVKMNRRPLKIDLLVEGLIPIEGKSLNFMGRSEVSQIFKYLRFGNYKVGYIINFNAEIFKATHLPKDYDYLMDGIYRVII